MRYYLVGGAVRDLLLGITPHEFDLVFEGAVSDFLQASATARKVGQQCPVYIAGGRDHVPLQGADIEEDLTKRDITINALALDSNGVIHALPRTFADLREGIIRPASPSAFMDDPARVFRAARFTATLPGFHPASETLGQMRLVAACPRMAEVAPERIGNECRKAMLASNPALFPATLAEGDALAPWLQELQAARSVPAGPAAFHGDDSVFIHTMKVMERTAFFAAALPPEERGLAAWMALCHDLGKISTDPALLPRHIDHEKRGETLAQLLSRRLRLPLRWEKAGMLGARLHMKAGMYPRLRPGTRVDLLHSLHAAGMTEPFLAMVMADAGDDRIRSMAHKDLAAMLAVSLPPAFHNRGKASAAKLRELRALALEKH